MGQAEPSRGCFVTLEGIDGCGKTTQAALLAAQLESTGRKVVRLREPGGTPIGEKIRALLLDPANSDMSDDCELLLYEAARAQLVRQVIDPALARGAIVLCDRFYDSTLAYQAGGRGIDAQLVRLANTLGSCGVSPLRTIVLDLEPSLAFARATKGGADRLEGEGLAFQNRVRQSYLQLADEDPSRVRVVDASGTVEEVFSRISQALADVLPLSCVEERSNG
ncbi:MAG: dTMP kinase [Tractidigestivibacter sp.]|jgi:dTMP kinase|uniref:dTMP kinase n=1 Tax=Tractidigestivibacter sp. TaxID=2847320 RepID=UPI003D8C1DC5